MLNFVFCCNQKRRKRDQPEGLVRRVIRELVKVVLFASWMLNDFDTLKVLSEISIYCIFYTISTRYTRDIYSKGFFVEV